jgi:hypothetical protein
MPAQYGGGKADAVRIERDRAPVDMRQDIEAWEANYARVVAFVEQLYLDERHPKVVAA